LAEAEVAERKALDISPTYASGHYNLALLYLAEGRREEALSTMQRAAYYRTEGLASIYFALGRKVDSDAALAQLTHEHASDAALEIAEARAYRGELDEALQWLDRAYQQKDAALYLIKGDLQLKKLEGDPRYKAFLRKMNLPE
jgi:Flp pilus assembly protein TadD